MAAATAVVRSNAVFLLLFVHCLLVLPLYVRFGDVVFVVVFFVLSLFYETVCCAFLIRQSSC